MKKSRAAALVAAAAAVAIGAASCSKKDGEPPAPSPAATPAPAGAAREQQGWSEGELPPPAPERTLSKADGVMLYTGWTLYKEDKDGKMISAQESTAGDRLSVYTEGGQPVEKEAIRKLQNGTESKFTFTSVRTEDGDDLWTRNVFVGLGTPAVVTKDDNLYSAPDLAALTATKVKAGQVIAIDGGGDSGFAEMLLFSEKTPYGKAMYIERGSISSDEGLMDAMAAGKRLEELGDKVKPVVRAEVEAILAGGDR